jgi:putative chitinase
MALTNAQLSSIVPTLHDPKLSLYVAALNSTMLEFGINTPAQQAMFLAQIAHESMGFFYTKELASGAAYENREDLGNTQPGDGILFKGRGLIQITGRANYVALMMALNIDCVVHPEILEAPDLATRSAGWFWSSRNLNSIAALNTSDAFITVTKRINGGINGLADRQQYWAKAKKALGI